MSVISRLEVVNLLNHDRHSAQWNPWFRHETILFGGQSGVLQMPNGKGKTTIAEAIAALFSRQEDRMKVVQGRMAFANAGHSHFRIELVKGGRDLHAIAGGNVPGEPWVIGMFGTKTGPVRFYTYQGTLEKVAVVRQESASELVLFTEEEIERAVKGQPDSRWDPDEHEWRNRLVGRRHLPKAAIEEMVRLQKMGGAEKAQKFFAIETKAGQRFDEAFFFHQIAPDLINDLMSAEGEEEERRAARRAGRVYQPDRNFENMVINTLRSVTDAKSVMEARTEKIKKWKEVAGKLTPACTHAEAVMALRAEEVETRAEIATNIAVWRWVSKNLPSWPGAESPDGVLGQLCAHMGVVPGGEPVVRDTGLGILLGKDAREVNQHLKLRRSIASLDETASRQVIENICDSGLSPPQGGTPAHSWYTLESALKGIETAPSLANGLAPEMAKQLLADGGQWARDGYESANPLAAQVRRFSDDRERRRLAVEEYAGRLNERQAAAYRRLGDNRSKATEIETRRQQAEKQVSDLRVFRERFGDRDPPTVFATEDRSYQELIGEKLSLEKHWLSLKNQKDHLDKDELAPGQDAERALAMLDGQGIRHVPVNVILREMRPQLTAADRWARVVKLFANLLFAPVVKNVAAAKAASETLDQKGVSLPVFVEGELRTLMAEGSINDALEGSFSHCVFGGAATPMVKAFIDASAKEPLRAQLTDQIGQADERLRALTGIGTPGGDTWRTGPDGLIAKTEQTRRIAEAAQTAILADAETVLTQMMAQLANLTEEIDKDDRLTKAITGLFQGVDISASDMPSEVVEIGKGWRGAKRKLEEFEKMLQPWQSGAASIHTLAVKAQTRFKAALRIEREFAIMPSEASNIEPDTEPAIKAALSLRTAVSECINNGNPVTATCASTDSAIEGLALGDLKARLSQKIGEVRNEVAAMKNAVGAALTGDTHVSQLQRLALEERAENPEGLVTAVEQFRTEVEAESQLNRDTKEEAKVLEGKAIEFLAEMVGQVKRRKVVLNKAMTEGTGAQFAVDFSLPDRVQLQNVFADLIGKVRSVDREVEAKLESATPQQVRAESNRRLRREIREETKRKILLSPSVKVSHSSLAGGQAIHLEDPDPDNPNKFSGGENTAISLAWMIRRARYALEKDLIMQGASLKQRESQIASAFMVLDGLFSDLSDQDLIRQAMEPLIAMRGQFQILAFVHPPEYLLKHDPEILPVLNIGRVFGDGWAIQHIGGDEWARLRKGKQGSIGISHFKIFQAEPPSPPPSSPLADAELVQ